MKNGPNPIDNPNMFQIPLMQIQPTHPNLDPTIPIPLPKIRNERLPQISPSPIIRFRKSPLGPTSLSHFLFSFVSAENGGRERKSGERRFVRCEERVRD